jgi:MerR family transcriptional regulator, heat shock protein HspR
MSCEFLRVTEILFGKYVTNSMNTPEKNDIPATLAVTPDNLLDPIITIGEAAQITGLSDSSLRKYEAAGLIHYSRTRGGYRMLSPEDLERVRMIQRLIKVKGLTLEGIRRLWALLPCWEFKGCSAEERENCGVVGESSNDPCWVIQWNKGCCNEETCRECEVYRTAATCTEDLKSLVFDLLLGRADSPLSKRLNECRHQQKLDSDKQLHLGEDSE